jgi:hypothetical protein
MRKEPEIPISADSPAPLPDVPLSLAEWEALPISSRVSSRLADVLLGLDDIETDLFLAEATDLRWLSPQLREVSRTIHQLLQCVAS